MEEGDQNLVEGSREAETGMDWQERKRRGRARRVSGIGYARPSNTTIRELLTDVNLDHQHSLGWPLAGTDGARR